MPTIKSPTLDAENLSLSPHVIASQQAEQSVTSQVKTGFCEASFWGLTWPNHAQLGPPSRAVPTSSREDMGKGEK